METSSQNASNGRQGSGTVSLVTKAGTNLFHGDLFEFFRHHDMNATSPFAAVNPATGERRSDGLVRNQFGGTFGGPIARDRIFFFGAYQGTRATQTPADIVTFIPTAAMLAGDFSTVASAQCRAQGNLVLPAALGFVNNRISPAQLSPAALKISRRLPTTTDPCGQISYSRKTLPREGQPIARIDWQISQNHSLFGRYMRTTTFWDPALVNSDTILSAAGAGAGGRDSSSQSLAIGDTMVLSNTVVNNIRFTANRTNVHRTHADMFGPEDVGVNIYTPIPDYMLLSVTGGFSINTGTETDSFYRPNTYCVLRRPDADSREPPVGVRRVGGLLGLEDELQRPVAGHVQLQRLRDRLAARRFPARQHLRVPAVHAVHAGHQAEVFRALRAGHVAAVAAGDDELRGAVGALVPAAAPAEPDLQLRHRPVQRRQRSTTYPQAPPGLSYPGDEGFPTTGGDVHRMDEPPAARRDLVGPEGRRPDGAAGRLRHEQQLHRRRVLFRCGPGAAVWSGAAADQPAAAAPSTIRGVPRAGPTRIR